MSISREKTSLFFKLSISVTVFGALFTFISWSVILLGAIGMVIFHSIQFFQKEDRAPLDYARYLLIISFSCNYIVYLLSLPYENILQTITKLALVAFLIFYIKKFTSSHLENQQNKGLLFTSLGTENMSYLLADLATVYIVIASLFKILNWKIGILNADLLLIIGLFSALISILVSAKSVRS